MSSDEGMASGLVAQFGVGERQGEEPRQQPEPQQIGHGQILETARPGIRALSAWAYASGGLSFAGENAPSR